MSAGFVGTIMYTPVLQALVRDLLKGTLLATRDWRHGGPGCGLETYGAPPPAAL